MADSEEARVRKYLQAAHDRGGGWSMAMRMMARHIEVLEDRMERAGMETPQPAKLTKD